MISNRYFCKATSVSVLMNLLKKKGGGREKTIFMYLDRGCGSQGLYFFHSQLHDVLSKSDRMMAVVKDLFGDDPRVIMNYSVM